MRMELYKVEIERPDRRVTGYLVASHEMKAEEIVFGHEIDLNQENRGVTIERVDETLPEDRRKGLDALLEHAPVGFASYCEPIGWIPHAIPVQKLQLFAVEELSGATHFVIAPTAEVAAEVFCDCVPIPDEEARLFRILDGFSGLGIEELRNLPALLEFGPIGLVKRVRESGWLAA